jgi:hypothetical protein
MAPWMHHSLIFVFGVANTVPCIAGEYEMNQGSNAADTEFVNLNCSEWVETDRAKLISFGEKIKQISNGPWVNDFVWAYQITTEINMKFLKKDPGLKKILCTTRVETLTDKMKGAAPFRVKDIK